MEAEGEGACESDHSNRWGISAAVTWPSPLRSNAASRSPAVAQLAETEPAVAAGVEVAEEEHAPVRDRELSLPPRQVFEERQGGVHLVLVDLAVAVAVHQPEEALERLPALDLGEAERLALVRVDVLEEAVIDLAGLGDLPRHVLGVELEPDVAQLDRHQRVVGPPHVHAGGAEPRVRGPGGRRPRDRGASSRIQARLSSVRELRSMNSTT